MNRILKFAAVSSLLLCLQSVAAPPPDLPVRLTSQKAINQEFWIDANSLLMFTSNEGWFGYDAGAYFGKTDGLYYPFTTVSDIVNNLNNSTLIFAAGIWMGGIDSATGDTLITAADYYTDFWPGPMVGTLYDPNANTLPGYRVFKIYSDSLASNPNLDYTEWPANQGAPVDNLGHPLLSGDQTLWSVYNDANFGIRTGLPSSDSGIGVEIQSTTWASDTVGPEGLSIYLKYKLINKGTKTVKNFFICLWLDPDLGDLDDDFVGCDTLDNIFYCYNSGPDAVYGSAPPAVGAKLIQGPITPSPGDTAFVDSKKIANFKNLGMYSFGRFYNGLDPFNHVWAYQYMNGLDASSGGVYYVNGTHYAVPGDPVTSTGDLDFGASDRRMLASFGPIDFRPNDTQQIIIKVGVGQGNSPLTSITELREVLNFVPPPVSCCTGIRGDLNADGSDNTVLDMTFLINFLFRGGPPAQCFDEANLDGTGAITVLDLTFIINDIFRGGPSPGPCP